MAKRFKDVNVKDVVYIYDVKREEVKKFFVQGITLPDTDNQEENMTLIINDPLYGENDEVEVKYEDSSCFETVVNDRKCYIYADVNEMRKIHLQRLRDAVNDLNDEIYRKQRQKDMLNNKIIDWILFE